MGWNSVIKPITVLAFLGALVIGVCAQGPSATAKLAITSKSIVAGSPLTAVLSITFPEGYHAYQNPPSEDFEIPVKVELGKATTFKLIKVSYPKGTPLAVGGETKPSAVYTDTIQIPLSLKAPAKPGSSALEVTVNYQQCNASSCLPPDTIMLSTKLVVKPAAKKGSKPKKS